MNRTEIANVLNCVLRVLCRSLPMYLSETRPWKCRNDQQVATALENVVVDQKAYASQVVDEIHELGEQPITGPDRIEFTNTNDLALDFLVGRLVQRQGSGIATLQRCVTALSKHPKQRLLVEEILGNAKGHQDILEELRAVH